MGLGRFPDNIVELRPRVSRRLNPKGLCLLWLVFLPGAGALAQTDPDEAINWVYGAYFGMGRYKLNNGDSTYVLSGRPRKRWKEAALDDDGNRTIGVEMLVPIAVGVYDLDPTNIGQPGYTDNFSTLSAVPGAEFEIPLNARWSIKPLVHVGYGTEIDGGQAAWIFWTGVRSQARFAAEEFDWALVNSLTYLGYSSNYSTSGNLLSLLTAIEFERGLRFEIADHPVRLHWHLGYTDYLNAASLAPRTTGFSAVEIDDEWEIGAAFSTSEHRLGIKRMRFDRIGLVYRFSGNGDFEGIGLTFSSLFER